MIVNTNITKIITLLLGTLFTNCSFENEVSKNKPNIIFIMADDMGAWSLGADKSAINAFTPNLDKLANSGIIFNNCFSNGANCSPSRASLITGRFPSETGVTDVINSDKGGLSLELKTFPQLLKAEGYNTALVGKWHLGEYMDEYLPLNRGYLRFTGFPHGGCQSYSPEIMIENEWHTAHGKYTTDLLTDYAMSYIQEFSPKKTGKPFLLSLHYWAPHANTSFPDGMEPEHGGRSWLPLKSEDTAHWDTLSVQFPDPDFPNLDSVRLTRMIKEYHSSVHAVDRNIGRLLIFLKENSLLDNTVIIFTSDHGYMSGHNGLWHKGRGWWMTVDGIDTNGLYGDKRYNLYDNTTRVPCIIYWPKVIKQSSEIDETVSFVDWFPTLLSIAGIKDLEDLNLRGRNILPLLKKETLDWNNDLYTEFINLRSYRTPNWKLVLDFSLNPIHELYDLENDKNERYNLYNSKRDDIAEIKQDLQQKLIAKMKEINDPLLNTINH